MNCKLQFFMGLVLLFNIVNSIKLTKDEVLSLTVFQEYDNITCPEYSYKDKERTDSSRCYYTFYCISDDNCQSDIDPKSPYFEFVEDSGNIRKYAKNKRACTQDSDCLSNVCTNSTCVAGGKSQFTECIDRLDVSSNITKTYCGRLDGEECSLDSQCAGECSSHCESYHDRNPVSEHQKMGFTVLIIFLYSLPVIGILFCICIVCCCIKHQDKKEKKRKLTSVV